MTDLEEKIGGLRCFAAQSLKILGVYVVVLMRRVESAQSSDEELSSLARI